MGRFRIELKRPYLGIVICLLLAMSITANYLKLSRGSSQCAPVEPSAWARVRTYLRSQYGPTAGNLEITKSEPLPDSCIQRLVVKVPSANKSRVWFLSEDHRYIFSSIGDLSHPLSRGRGDNAVTNAPVSTAELQQGAAPTTGPAAAQVVIVEFSDFQCPYCKKAAGMLRQEMLKKHHDDVRLIFRNYPLSSHRWARTAAELGACIAKQSIDGFWVYYDEVFANQESLNSPSFVQDALRSVKRSVPRLDTASALSCVSLHGAAKEVDADIQLGNKYGISGTPTLFVNGKRLAGIRDEAYLDQIISQQTQLASN